MKALPVVRSSPAAPNTTVGTMKRSVLLVCMPFQWVHHAPISTALLGTVLTRAGIPNRELFPHLEFARIYGFYPYENNEGREDWSSEFLFTEQMNPQPLPADVEEMVTARFGPRAERDERFARFAAWCRGVLATTAPFDLVGLTTTFHQLTPSLWFAREVRKAWPKAKIVFGGAPCDNPMGESLRRAYPEIDYVLGGRGERTLVALATADEWPTSLYEYDRSGAPLDSLPLLDYDSFAAQANPYLPVRHRFRGHPGEDAPVTVDETGREALYWERFDLRLDFESSKGCWYGEKHHCTFCGLGSNMTFEAKAAQRTVDEIDHLWKRYTKNLFATDAILSRDYVDNVLPALAQRPDPRPRLFYEIKANVSRDDVRRMGEANVREVQPGIESLSSRLLRLLDKGVRGIQNVALLKWGRENDIRVAWNLLCGIPGETAADYHEMIAVMPHLVQLPPPNGANKIHLDRYSPYFEQYQKFGFEALRPNRLFRLLHSSLSDAQAAQVAWSFEGTNKACVPLDEYYDQLERAVRDWQERYVRGEGLYWVRHQGLIQRRDDEVEEYEATPLLVAIMDNSHQITSVDKLIAATGADADTIDEMVEEGFLFREGDRVVNVAIDRTAAALAAGIDA